MVKEACVGNINEALRAESLGADRVELCENLRVGGTTPSAGTITISKKILKIPVMVLIRPRSGNFNYSANEIEIMKLDIELCKKIGVQGIVIGALTKENSIDINLTNEFVKLARPLKVTFHKAIDFTADVIAEFKSLMKTDVDSVLTSGGAETAFDGKEIINEMVRISNGKIKIITAGKVALTDLPALQNVINAQEFHGIKIVGDLSD
jgi:copper homeostasis protein